MKVIKKNIVIISIIALIVFLITVTICFRFRIGIKVKSVECGMYDGEYHRTKVMYESYYSGNYNKNTEFIHSKDMPLSKDDEDYLDIACNISVKNRFGFSPCFVDAAICDYEYFKENLLYSYAASVAVETYVEPGEEQSISVIMTLYIGDMTKEDIYEFLDGVKIKVVSNDVLGNTEKVISLSECDNVSITNNITRGEN